VIIDEGAMSGKINKISCFQITTLWNCCQCIFKV